MKIEPVVQKISVDKLSSNTILDRNDQSSYFVDNGIGVVYNL